MLLCISTFVGMFAFVAGIAMLATMPGMLEVVLWEMVPLPIVIMVGGFLVSLVSLLGVRSMGDTFYEEDDVVRPAFKASCVLALIAAFVMCAIQVYLRFDFGSYGFFANRGGLREYISLTALEDTAGVLMLVNAGLSLFLGLPWYIITYFGGDFDRYVTVTRTQLSDGSSYESSRSESYVSVAAFIFMGALLTIPFVALWDSVIIYFVAAFYGVFVFGARSKNAVVVSSLIFGVAAIALTLVTLLQNV